MATHCRSGQLSVEFLLLLAITLIVLLGAIIISQSSDINLKQTKIRGEAQNTVNDLGAAAKEVYAQGTGAKKQVYITIPEGFEPQESFIANKSIKIRVAGSDYVDIESFEMRGTLPASVGGQWIWVVSEGNAVRIGYAMLSMDKNSLVINMEPNSSRNAQLRVTNIWHKEINVSLDKVWPIADVLLTQGPTSFALQPGQSQDIDIALIPNSNALGFFSGTMIVSAQDGSVEEQLKVPLTLIVARQSYGKRPSLMVVPSTFDAALSQNQNATRSFLVCTDSSTTISSASIIPPTGDAGLWLSGTTPLGPINPDTCIERQITLRVPFDANLGIYVGDIRFIGTDTDGAVASDQVRMKIIVGGTPYDTNGPVVGNISIGPRLLTNHELIVNAFVSDDLSAIKSCEIKIDSLPFVDMDSADGTFDNQNEIANYPIKEGLDSGTHTVAIQCIDLNGFVGPLSSSQFIVKKDILFIQLRDNMSESEYEWTGWLSNHVSESGYSWSYDVADSLNVMSGKIDLEKYEIIMMSEYDDVVGYKETLDLHRGKGKYVLMVGAANEKGLIGSCLTNRPANSDAEKSIWIIKNDQLPTRGAPLGPLRIYDFSDTRIFHAWDDYIGVPFAESDPINHFTVIGIKDNTLMWGAEKPYRFNENGDLLTGRIIDFALDYSE